jgi:hypothetical protein
MFVDADQLLDKTVAFGPELMLELKAMRAAWSVKLVEDWANWNIHECSAVVTENPITGAWRAFLLASW